MKAICVKTLVLSMPSGDWLDQQRRSWSRCFITSVNFGITALIQFQFNSAVDLTLFAKYKIYTTHVTQSSCSHIYLNHQLLHCQYEEYMKGRATQKLRNILSSLVY